jgi:hypothetical protein
MDTTFDILVNGEKYATQSGHVTYDEVCAFAKFPCPSVLKGLSFKVRPGWYVHVELGMIGH